MFVKVDSFDCKMHFRLISHLQVKLADPDVVSNPSEYQRLVQNVAELDEVLLQPFPVPVPHAPLVILLLPPTIHSRLSELIGCANIQEIQGLREAIRRS